MFSYITSLLADPRQTLIIFLLAFPARILAISAHEFAHAWMANRCGDPTARMMGRMTLNPVKHLDLLGTVMMLLLGFGWAKPVPVNMWKFKNPKKGMAITAAAGPIANLLIALVFLFLYGFLFALLHRPGRSLNWLLEMLYITAYLSIALAIFNIIPIPPLDGSKVLFSCISDRAYTKLMYYERYGMIILLVLVLLLSRTSLDPLSRAAYWVMDKLFFAANWGFGLAKLFV